MPLRSVPKSRAESAAVPASQGRIPFEDVRNLELSITQARCLTNVLSELCLPGGDVQAGECALDQLGPEKLYSTLTILEGILKKVDDDFHAGLDRGRTQIAAVAHG